MDRNAHVVALGSYPPYVRVFDLAGDLQAAFGTTGDGPGELRRPHTLAVQDGRILVAHGRGLSVFSATGELLAEAREPPFFPQTVSRGCEDDWVAYGKGREGPDGRTGWLHSLRFAGDSLVTRRVYADTSTWSGTLVRRARVTAWDGAGVVVFHQEASPPKTLRFACPSYSVSILATHPELMLAERRAVGAEDGTA